MSLSKKDRKPPASTLAKILGKFSIPIVGPVLGAKEAGKALVNEASRFALDRMSENLEPYNYFNAGTKKSTVDRFIDAVVLNKKEADREETEKYIEKGYGKIPDATFKERTDLLQMLAGKKQKYNTISDSPYAPTIGGKKGSKYYRSRGIENEIIKELGLSGKNIKSIKELENAVKEKSYGRSKTGGYTAVVPGLAAATYGINEDDKGLYLSYSDLWDLNPQEGAYKDEGPIGEKIKNKVINFGKKVATDVVNATATPANLYGRIYFDKKTGKLIPW
jgi:hypothetical protein